MPLMNNLLGKPLASDEEEENKATVLAGVPLLGLDALSSSAYGPEAAMTVLLPLGAAGIAYLAPIMGVILFLLAILYFSYRQTIAAYPTGGGSYTVAKENLGVRAGLVAAASLLLDYILNVAVGISAGVGALISAVPSLHSYRIELCLAILILITIVNLRGVKESGAIFAAPTYLFVACLTVVLGIGAVKAILSGGNPVPVTPPPTLPLPEAGLTGAATLWLIVRAFASGCTAMTGVEAVSNGVGAFVQPAVKNAQRTLTVIIVILAALLVGITYLTRAYHIGATPPEGSGYDSVISQLVKAVAGQGIFYYVTIGVVLAVLALSANTSFSGFPRLCRLLAEDDYLPHSFANRGRRLVYTAGIVILAIFAGILLIVFRGVTDYLIALFAVGAFGAFTLSQAGMVVHWRRHGGKEAMPSLLVNGLGAICTGIALIVVLAAKFTEGAWITFIMVPGLIWLFFVVKRHYEYVARRTATEEPLDTSALQPPVVVVPMRRWNIITRNALHFALGLSGQVVGVHVITDGEHAEQEAEELHEQWQKYVVSPAESAGLRTPELRIASSRYRRLFTPLMRQVLALKRDYPNRVIAVIIPELVESRWYQYFLHNQRATALKAALLFYGGSRVIVINVPWYLAEAAPEQPPKSE